MGQPVKKHHNLDIFWPSMVNHIRQCSYEVDYGLSCQTKIGTEVRFSVQKQPQDGDCCIQLTVWCDVVSLQNSK